MRSIVKSRGKDSAKRNSMIIGGLLVVVMFLSVLGYGFQDEEGDKGKVVEYNGIEFIERNGFWLVEDYGGVSFLFKYNPEQIEHLLVNVAPIADYSGQPLYISSEDNIALQEVVRNLGQVAQRTQPACLDKQECESEAYPVKNCSSNFIIIAEAEEKAIKQEENCVFIEGPEGSLVNITDSFLFNVLGI